MITRKIIPYNPELKELARKLRRNMTLSEVLLWNELKQKNMLGYDFDRQRPIGNFIMVIHIFLDTIMMRADNRNLKNLEFIF